jgi:hypothetical protein
VTLILRTWVTLSSQRRVGNRKSGEEPMFVDRSGKRFYFLISDYLKMVVDLSILFLFPNEVGSIISHGGDIDNRLKTLFDALRVPGDQNEVPKSDPFDYSDKGLFCLLEDDKLIGGLSIRTYQDHNPVDARTTRCLIEVKTRVISATWGNLSFI